MDVNHKVVRRCGAVTFRLIKAGWWVPAVILALLSLLGLANLGTSSPYLILNDLPPKDSSALPSKLLPVPHVAQGPTRWCYEASLSMVLQYYGMQATPEEIAAALGAAPGESTGIMEVFFGPVESYVTGHPGFSVRQNVGNWGFTDFARLIDAGVPVIVSTFGLMGHTVVVTGYTERDGQKYLYINDPSGYYTRLAWGTPRTRAAMVNWSQFSQEFWSETVVVRDPHQP